MRAIGVDLARTGAAGAGPEHAIVLLEPDGRVAHVEHAPTLPAVAGAVERLSGGEPFLLGVDAPVVVPEHQVRARPVEGLVRRKLGVRLPPGGRGALSAEPSGVAGETLLAALAAAGRPCLPYPDRNRRLCCLAEIHPQLIVKILMWQRSALAQEQRAAREELFRAYEPPPYRAADTTARPKWTRQAVAVDLVLGALSAAEGFDLGAARTALAAASCAPEVERAAAVLDATLIAATARRWLAAPESCLFLGDHESGYVILPADDFIRSLARGRVPEPPGRLFPQASLRERLGPHAQLRSGGLLDLPGRPHRTEADFKVAPRYEFDNLDEMLWWKHCRHLAGPVLPTEGLREMVVTVEPEAEPAEPPLRLARSRHRTLSFRFEPPVAWRAHVPTRDGKTYPFAVLRAVYETAPRAD